MHLSIRPLRYKTYNPNPGQALTDQSHMLDHVPHVIVAPLVPNNPAYFLAYGCWVSKFANQFYPYNKEYFLAN